MTTKAELRKVLDALIGDADEQTQMHERAQQRLYLTLGGAYLWWREARKVDGFLEELYAERRLVHRGSEENFTRLVRLVWQLGWDGMTPKVQNWARALRGLHHEYETNKDAYQVQNPQDKVRQFFQAMGGIGAVGNSVSQPTWAVLFTAVQRELRKGNDLTHKMMWRLDVFHANHIKTFRGLINELQKVQRRHEKLIKNSE